MLKVSHVFKKAYFYKQLPSHIKNAVPEAMVKPNGISFPPEAVAIDLQPNIYYKHDLMPMFSPEAKLERLVAVRDSLRFIFSKD